MTQNYQHIPKYLLKNSEQIDLPLNIINNIFKRANISPHSEFYAQEQNKALDKFIKENPKWNGKKQNILNQLKDHIKKYSINNPIGWIYLPDPMNNNYNNKNTLNFIQINKRYLENVGIKEFVNRFPKHYPKYHAESLIIKNKLRELQNILNNKSKINNHKNTKILVSKIEKDVQGLKIKLNKIIQTLNLENKNKNLKIKYLMNKIKDLV